MGEIIRVKWIYMHRQSFNNAIDQDGGRPIFSLYKQHECVRNIINWRKSNLYEILCFASGFDLHHGRFLRRSIDYHFRDEFLVNFRFDVIIHRPFTLFEKVKPKDKTSESLSIFFTVYSSITALWKGENSITLIFDTGTDWTDEKEREIDVGRSY